MANKDKGEGIVIEFDAQYGDLKESIDSYQERVSAAHQQLHDKSGKGNDYLGWLDWPLNFDKEEFDKIVQWGEEIRNNANTLVVCGIGGSYLGARAVIEMVQGLFPTRDIEIIYLGNTFSSTYFLQVQEYLKNRNIYVNVISKSGTTLETAMAFRMLKQFMEDKYGTDSKNRIIATTDKSRGVLKEVADLKGYRTLTIPDDIGGRYSVNTAVGLLPLAACGIDIASFMEGFKAGYTNYGSADLQQNPAYRYAVARRILQNQGKDVELLVTYEPHMTMFAEWWKQLFGESEGKDGLGIYPASVNFSTDLHSMGQFVQEGKKILFETLVEVKKPMLDATFPSDAEDIDKLNYLAGKGLDYVNKTAAQGTLSAHHDTGKVPNLIVKVADTTAYSVGDLMYFFFKAIAMTSYLLDINPFNQPGVEVYKKNMFGLLGKK